MPALRGEINQSNYYASDDESGAKASLTKYFRVEHPRSSSQEFESFKLGSEMMLHSGD